MPRGYSNLVWTWACRSSLETHAHSQGSLWQEKVPILGDFSWNLGPFNICQKFWKFRKNKTHVSGYFWKKWDPCLGIFNNLTDYINTSICWTKLTHLLHFNVKSSSQLNQTWNSAFLRVQHWFKKKKMRWMFGWLLYYSLFLSTNSKPTKPEDIITINTSGLAPTTQLLTMEKWTPTVTPKGTPRGSPYPFKRSISAPCGDQSPYSDRSFSPQSSTVEEESGDQSTYSLALPEKTRKDAIQVCIKPGKKITKGTATTHWLLYKVVSAVVHWPLQNTIPNIPRRKFSRDFASLGLRHNASAKILPLNYGPGTYCTIWKK